MLTAISTTSTMPLVRVPWLDSGIIMKMLDAALWGDQPHDKFPRRSRDAGGRRALSAKGVAQLRPIRALLYAGADYPQHATTPCWPLP